MPTGDFLTSCGMSGSLTAILLGKIMLLRIYKPRLKSLSCLPAYLQKRTKHIKGMKQPGINIDLCLHPGFFQSVNICHGFCVERLGCAYKRIHGRKSGIIISPRRRRIARHLLVCDSAQIFSPAVVISLCVPDRGVIVPRSFGVLTVDHGI